MRLILRRAVVAAAAVGVLCACGGGETDVAGGQAYVAGDGSIVTVAAVDRRPAPDLRGTTLAGQPFDLARMRGKVVILNVWASWCAPCRSEAPGLAEVARQLPRKDAQLVGLVTRDSEASARAFVERFALDYPQVVDTDGALQLRFRDNLPPQAIPSTLVIDRQGRVAARVLGAVTPAGLRSVVEPVLAEADA